MKKKIKIFAIMMVMCILAQGILCFAADHESSIYVHNGGSGSMNGTYGKMTYDFRNSGAKTIIKNTTNSSRYMSATASEYLNGSPTGVMSNSAGNTAASGEKSTQYISRKSDSRYRYICSATIYYGTTSTSGTAETFLFTGIPN